MENKKFHCRICNTELVYNIDKKDLICSCNNEYISCFERFMIFIEHLFYTNYDVPDNELTKLRYDIIKYFYMIRKNTIKQ